MKKIAGIGVVVVVVGLLGWRIVDRILEGGGESGGRGAGHAVAVEVAPVRTASVRDVGRFSGSLAPRSRFVVAPKIPGRLERLTVNVGDAVTSGVLIAVLDDDEYALAVEQSRAELAVAQAGVAEAKSAMDVAKRELDRVRDLHEKRVAAEAELDETEARFAAAQAKHDVALAEVARRGAALKAAEVRLSYTRIHASWNEGAPSRVVGDRFVDEGGQLSANAPIVSILDNAVLKAEIDVIERDYPKIRIGQTAIMDTDAFSGVTFTGAIARVSPLLKELSRQARVEIDVPNADGRLKPGMFVRATLEFGRRDNATVVPAAALARREGREGVFLTDPGEHKARFVPVTTGIVDGDAVEILEPAALSGVAITLGHHLLEDGAAIQVSGPAAGGKKGGRP